MKKKLKIICVGDCRVGKTRFISTICNGVVDYYYNPTIGIEFKSGSLIICHEYKIDYWDLSGDKRFECIIRNYFKNADIIVLFFNYDNINSIKNISHWIALVREYNPTIKINLIGINYKNELPNDVSSELFKYTNFTIYNLKKFGVFDCENLIKSMINDLENDNYNFEQYIERIYLNKQRYKNDCCCKIC